MHRSADTDLSRTGCPRELDGVADQVREHLPDTGGLAPQGREWEIHLQDKGVPLRRMPVLGKELVDDGSRLERVAAVGIRAVATASPSSSPS